jgi:hypothetical protein
MGGVYESTAAARAMVPGDESAWEECMRASAPGDRVRRSV